jgi:hypothetical protein
VKCAFIKQARIRERERYALVLGSESEKLLEWLAGLYVIQIIVTLDLQLFL